MSADQPPPGGAGRPPAAGALVEVRDLSVTFPSARGPVRAVRGVSFSIAPGEAVGLVGESGSGKTTVLRSIAALLPRQIVGPGEVLIGGESILDLKESELARIRGSEVGLVFQDPVNCFNPSFTIGHQLRRVVRLHRPERPADGYDAEVLRMLDRVGIDGRGKLSSYPFEFSQGQLQRLMIAAACLAGHPSVLLADEPTTSLDVTTEAQIIELLRDLRQELGMALLLVTHNLALAAQLCDRVLVMYAGRLVESSPVEDLFARPAHPYARQLVRSVPTFPHPGGRLYSMPGDPAGALGVAAGCPFAPRCEEVVGEICRTEDPPLRQASSPGRLAACHIYDPVAPDSAAEAVQDEVATL